MYGVHFSGKLTVRCTTDRRTQAGRVHAYLRRLAQKQPDGVYLNHQVKLGIDTILRTISLSRLQNIVALVKDRLAPTGKEPRLTLQEGGQVAEIDYGNNQRVRTALQRQLLEAGVDVMDSEGDLFDETTLQQTREKYYALAKPRIETVVGKLLLDNGLTVATAESCTGGLASSLLTNTPGSSDYTSFNAVTYSEKAKRDQVRVPQAVLDQYGVYSYETAMAMAEGIRQVNDADYGLAFSGLTGHTKQFAQYPGGVVFIGLAGKNKPTVGRLLAAPPHLDRPALKQYYAETGLKLLKQYIEGTLEPVERQVLDHSQTAGVR